jgi:hypothetical protein
LSQSRAPLSPDQCAKNSGHYRPADVFSSRPPFKAGLVKSLSWGKRIIAVPAGGVVCGNGETSHRLSSGYSSFTSASPVAGLRGRSMQAENARFIKSASLVTVTGVIAKRPHTRKCLPSTKWQQRVERSCHSRYRTEKRTNAVLVEFSTERHRQTPSQQGGLTGRRLRARSGDFSYPDCRSSRRALASQRAGGFAPTQHPQNPTPERLRG